MTFYGIGHAMVDIHAFVSDAGFERLVNDPSFPLKEGRAVHPDAATFNAIMAQVQATVADSAASQSTDHDRRTSDLILRFSGGTTANILKAATRYGADTFFTGSTGSLSEPGRLPQHDADSIFLANELSRHFVHAELTTRDGSTGRFLIIHSRSGRQCLVACPSAARMITPEQLNESYTESADCFIMEGMQCMNEALVSRVTEQCHIHGIPVVIDTSSNAGAEATARLLERICTKVRLILFANQAEAAVLSKTAPHLFTADGAPTRINPCSLYVLKKGADGAQAWYKKSQESLVPTITCTVDALSAHVVDSTGAGDSFAAAFLVRWFSKSRKIFTKKTLLHQSLMLGAETAAKVVEHYGSDI